MKARILVHGSTGITKDSIIEQIINRAETKGLVVDVRCPILQYVHPVNSPIEKQSCDISIHDVRDGGELTIELLGVHTPKELNVLLEIIKTGEI